MSVEEFKRPSLERLFPGFQKSNEEIVEERIKESLMKVKNKYEEFNYLNEEGDQSLVAVSETFTIIIKTDFIEAEEDLIECYQAIYRTYYPTMDIVSQYSDNPESALNQLSLMIKEGKKFNNKLHKV